MEKILANLDTIVERILDDWDCTIAITGRKRRGKSTLAYHCANYLAKKLKSKVWYCFTFPQIMEAMENGRRRDIIFGDETISFLQKGKWNSPEAVKFIEMHDSLGYKNYTYFLIMPCFSEFLKGFREDRINAHFWLPERGVVQVFLVKENRMGCYVSRKPAFMDTFPPLSPEEYKKYERMKHEALTKNTETRAYGGYMHKREVNEMLKKIICKHCGRKLALTQTERAQYIGVSVRQLQRYEHESKLLRRLMS